MFSPESDDTLVTLLTFTGSGITTPIRLADNYNQRLSETADEIVYGIKSRSNDYLFMPFNITLPTEESDSAPRCSIAINDVTRYLTPVIRNMTGAPNVLIELVLKSTPDVVEASFPGFQMAAISYNANAVSGELQVKSLAAEPFPANTFTPSYFPGLF